MLLLCCWLFLLWYGPAKIGVTLELNEGPGRWFRNTDGPVAGVGSLAVGTPGVEVRFRRDSNTVHTMTSLLYPTGALNMPFDAPPQKGSAQVELTTRPAYMFSFVRFILIC